MGSPLRILIVEDSREDVILLLRNLNAGGFDVSHEVVSSALALKDALAKKDWDAVISDDTMPGFDALGALRIFKERGVDIPFIIVSGTIEQDVAVAAMRAGAHDYLFKDNLSRLVPAIRRELDEARNRESRRKAERELSDLKEELARQLSDMTLLHQLGVRISTAPDAPTVMTEILTAVTSLQSTDAGALVLFDNRGRKLAVTATLGLPNEEVLEVPEGGISQQAVIEKRNVIVEVATSTKALVLGERVRTAGYVTAQSIPLFTRGGAPLGCLETYQKNDRDLTPRETRLIRLYTHQAGQVLDNMMLYKQAQEASRLKDEFVSMVSHELRTPLTPIIGAVHMIRTNPENGTLMTRGLDMIERNVYSQSQIIEDLLDISRIVSGKMQLKITLVDLKAAISAAAGSLRPAAEAKQLPIEVRLGERDVIVHGDFERLRQIVWNLLSNAVKFTPKGGRITVELQATDEYNEIVVSDSGIGIRQEFLPFVFDRFRQADGSFTRAHGGLGLGLSIVRQLVELHGGTVTVQSGGDGQGASFTVRIPTQEASHQVDDVSPNHRKVG